MLRREKRRAPARSPYFLSRFLLKLIIVTTSAVAIGLPSVPVATSGNVEMLATDSRPIALTSSLWADFLTIMTLSSEPCRDKRLLDAFREHQHGGEHKNDKCNAAEGKGHCQPARPEITYRVRKGNFHRMILLTDEKLRVSSCSFVDMTFNYPICRKPSTIFISCRPYRRKDRR